MKKGIRHGTEFDRPEDVTQEDLPPGVKLRDHVVDGIYEYDQRLPKWWLAILFGVLIFSVIYWLIDDQHAYTGHEMPALEVRLAELATKRLASSIDVTNDTLFWEMSRDGTFVHEGQAAYQMYCAACHGQDLQGGIGFPLVNTDWVHGGSPSEIYATIAHGIPDSGMQAWEGLLGQKRIAEITAFIISRNPAPLE